MTGTINYISGAICLTILVVACIVLLIYQIKLEKQRNEYIKKLNDHDKAVILNYIRLNGLRDKKRKDEQK